jgi:hypothetical protein
MPLHVHIAAHTLTILFLIGVAGCLVSIPLIAIKFASVLFEKDEEEAEPEAPSDNGKDK